MTRNDTMDEMSLRQRIETWVRPAIREIAAYHVADASGLVKLDAMENPYALPEAVRRGLMERLAEVSVNRYPDPDAAAVRKSLAALYGVQSPMDMLFGNGSDELIQILALALGGPGRVILSVEPAFVMYRMIATFTQSEYVGVPLNADFSIDLDATLKAIERHQPALIFWRSPITLPVISLMKPPCSLSWKRPKVWSFWMRPTRRSPIRIVWPGPLVMIMFW